MFHVLSEHYIQVCYIFQSTFWQPVSAAGLKKLQEATILNWCEPCSQSV